MPVLDIRLDGDGWIPEVGPALRDGTLVHLADGAQIIVAGLRDGMRGGPDEPTRPSVAIAFRLPDDPGGKTWVLAETSLRLFLTAADALRARFGDPRYETF